MGEFMLVTHDGCSRNARSAIIYRIQSEPSGTSRSSIDGRINQAVHVFKQVNALSSQPRSTVRVTREVDFSYGHRLMNYDGKCRHLHGHNGRAVITLEGQSLDSRGILVDFSEIKRKVQQWIDENLDHNLLLCREDPLVPVLRECGERVFEMDCNPTAENIARLIFDQAKHAGLPVVEVLLWETEHCGAAYSAGQ